MLTDLPSDPVLLAELSVLTSAIYTGTRLFALHGRRPRPHLLRILAQFLTGTVLAAVGWIVWWFVMSRPALELAFVLMALVGLPAAIVLILRAAGRQERAAEAAQRQQADDQL
ncbi:hypothetical protein [Kitasatospora griseola]|uniref:hypothetical protein n=1 Tax=Kitasatospora griseola TaxID=2064 RepID=UPI003652D3A0